MEAVHEEILPTLIYTLNQLGYKPDLFLNSRSKKNKGSIFDFCQAIDYNIEYVELNGAIKWKNLREKILKNKTNYEFLVATTFQNDGTSQYLASFNMPIWGIIHNAKKFLNQKFTTDLVKNGKAKAICLSQHVARYVNTNFDTLNKATFFMPLYMDDRFFIQHNRISLLLENDVFIGLTGSVLFKDRDYINLIDQLNKIYRNHLEKNVKFVICGGGKNRIEFESLISSSSTLQEWFIFAPINKDSGYVEYKHYTESLMKCHFVMSLFHPRATYYFSTKISSVITSSLAYQKPLLLNNYKHTTYTSCFTYDHKDYFNIVKHISSLNDYNDIIKALHTTIEKSQLINKENISQLL